MVAAHREFRMGDVRKLTAIMAVDVVGYSRLMGEDEAGTARAVREHREAARPLVAARDGRIVKTMGDGLLLEFPSIVGAVDCAIAVQKLMADRNGDAPQTKKIVYRIGVHLGDVLVDGDDILGEGVNIAARLEGVCEPGGVLISGAAHEHVRGRIDAQFTDLGEMALKNIGRPVRAYAVGQGGANAAAMPAAVAPPRQVRPRLSLVVLPFTNMGGDREQEHFVDGVTESLTTDLSRIRGAVVIGRNTAFAYKGKPVDLKQIGQELTVRYALEGSVQRGGNRMRINAQLIDTETGSHIWAERFDKPVADLLDTQDEIVARLAGALNAQLVSAEARRAEQAVSVDSMDLYFQGMACFNKGLTPENLNSALGFFDRALAADPFNVDALIGSGRAHSNLGMIRAADFSASMRTAEDRLEEALSFAPNEPRAHMALGLVYTFTRRIERGIAECEHALALDRNLAHARAGIGQGLILAGRDEETEEHILEALRLSPGDTMAASWMHAAAIAKGHLGLWDEAVDWGRRATRVGPNFAGAVFTLAAALARLGRLDEARSVMARGRALRPLTTVAGLRSFVDALTNNAVHRARNEPLLEGMLEAGLPAE
jgi:TolB-like protein/class 3 adenylate cyclase